ncbi:MAG: DegV family EDD domain-containing protein [Mycoplasma sp.]|nr:DegV family EDD domain-containing protein [Mycoplasma sp.]
MKKLGIVIDSFSGLTEKEAKKNGLHYLSLQIILDNKLYKEGKDFNSFEDAMKMVDKAKDKKTSQPNPADIEKLFKEIKDKYEKIIYICIGSKMSSAFSTASIIAKELGDKFKVVDNSLSGPAYLKASKYILEEVNAGRNLDDVLLEVKKWEKSNTHTWILPENIEQIQKGGRIKKGSKFLLSKLSIIPMIKYVDGSPEVRGIRRGFAKSVTTIIKRIIESIGEKNINDYEFHLIHTTKENTKNIAIKKLNDAGIHDFKISVSCIANGIQCGIGAISISAYKKEIKK